MGKLVSMVTRGKVQLAVVGPRTMLQVTALDGETFSNVELLLPPGVFALPAGSADVLLLQVNGTRDHKVALGGDNIADRQADLQAGDRGMARGTARLIFRNNMTVLQDPAKIVLQTPQLFWSPDGETLYPLATNAHTHTTPSGVSYVPNTSTGMITE
jgi:phage gp45-like